jgi:DNA-binding transcriptional regulator PaaX
MPSDQDVTGFISSSFRSVWAIELLLHLKRNPGRSWPKADLVETLRASELVVASGLHSLLAAGLVVEDADGSSRYAPASPDIERLADATEAIYAKKPDAVRRMIVSSATDGVTAFADAFRLRRD